MNEMITLKIKCPFCGELTEVTVTALDYVAYTSGELAQKAFPYLSPDERELIISGMCPDCQSKFFGSDEEEVA